ncbi:MAG TPA: hypothetical protein VI876_05820 [Dehalococcoidia bacterium]|nr:hypothetical protein [Dehalococcoidia bacterium]
MGYFTAAKRSLPIMTFMMLALLAAACSGGSEQKTLDPESADELVHAALLAPGDLPSGGWTTTANDDFTFELAPGAACDSMRSLNAKLAENRVGRAQRQLERNPGPTVELEIGAYKSSEGLSELLTSASGLLGDASVNGCQAESVRLLRGDPTITLTPATPSISAPRNGFAFAVDIDLPGPGGSRTAVHFETYIWLQDNISIRAEIVALKGVPVAELATTILQRLATSVDNALEGK